MNGYTVSRLQVILEGITGKFDDALKSSESRLKTFSRSMETFNKILTLGGAAIVFNKVAQTIGRIQDAYLAIDKSSPWAREYKNIGTYQANIQDAVARLDEAGGRILVAFGPQLAKVSSFWSEVANSIAKAVTQQEAFRGVTNRFNDVAAKSLITTQIAGAIDDETNAIKKLNQGLAEKNKTETEQNEAQRQSLRDTMELAKARGTLARATILDANAGKAAKDSALDQIKALVALSAAVKRADDEIALKQAENIAEKKLTIAQYFGDENGRIEAETDKAILSSKRAAYAAIKELAKDRHWTEKEWAEKTVAIEEEANRKKAEATLRATVQQKQKGYEAISAVAKFMAEQTNEDLSVIQSQAIAEEYAAEYKALEAIKTLEEQGTVSHGAAEDARTRITKEGAKKRVQITIDAEDEIVRKRWQTVNQYVQATGSLIGSLAELSDAYDAHSKRDFERTKKLRYAEAVVNTAAAIISIWAQGSEHWAVKVLQTAAVAASCAANLKRISDMQYDGGGGGGSTAAAAASAAAGAEGGGAASTAAPRQTVLVQGAVGGMISIDMLRELFADAARRGVVIDQIDIVAGRRRAA